MNKDRKSGRWMVFVWSALLSVWVAAPASAQYRFTSWTVDNGLPQNSVTDIRQTRDGYLWLTTFDGLVRFDGVRFTVFNKGNQQQSFPAAIRRRPGRSVGWH